jgi:uncharacterized protein (DUF58 family)
MTPKLTARGRAFLVALAASFLVGAAAGAVVATSVAGIGLVGLACAYVATLPHSRRLRAETIELAWWVDSGRGTRRNRVVARSPFALRLFVRHQGNDPVRIRRLELVSDTVDRVADGDVSFTVPGTSRADISVRCVCRAAGLAVLHGARVDIEGPLGFFETRLYFPNRLRLAVVPLRASTRAAVTTPLDARVIPRRTSRQRRDEGTDIHELRDFQPGDPFRRIAWKTSARVGRLIVRELEREELGSVEIVLDAGPTMRDGVPGDRRLDRAISLALGIAEDALRRGERVGLATADRRVLTRIDPESRPDQRERIIDGLLSSLSCVDADRTVDDDARVGRAVAKYVRFQEGAEFLDPRAVDGVHLERLALHVAARAKRYHEVQAKTQAGKILRRYAELVGVPVQHRTDRDPAARTAGLGSALQSIEPRRRSPSRIVLVTDAHEVDFSTKLRPTLMHLRKRGHVVEVLLVARSLPFATDLELRPGSLLETSYVEDDVARLRSISTGLRALGLGVHIDARIALRAEVA